MKNDKIEKLYEQYMKSAGIDFQKRWSYVTYIVLKAYKDHYLVSKNKQYFEFIKKFIDDLFVGDTIPQIDITYHSIDQIKMADILFFLFDETKDEKYVKIIHELYKQLTTTYPRTSLGSFWHKDNYPNQVWLDGLYMGQPFYAMYLKRFKEKADYTDIINQFLLLRKTHYQIKYRVYIHAYDDSRQMFWADKQTGQSTYAWLRASGWLAMALVDVIEIIDQKELTKPLSEMLEDLINDLTIYQDNGGMWYQIIDLVERKDNYLETSGTAMISYAILKAVRLGIIEEKYKDIGIRAFEGIINTYLYNDEEGVKLGGICKSAGLGVNPDTHVFRDGSYEYYIKREPIVVNNGHGVGPFLMAYNELTL